MTFFQDAPIWLNVAAFIAAAAAVWLAGTRLAGFADRIIARTGLGEAVVGIVLLATVTSLPEVAVSITASVAGDSALALNNLIGGLARQVAILAIADMAIGRDALTSVLARPAVLIQGVLCVVLLSVAVIGLATEDVAIGFVGLASLALLPLYAGGVWLVATGGRRETWTPNLTERQRARVAEADDAEDAGPEGETLRGLLTKSGIAAVVILFAGFVVARTGSALAEQTGIGGSFVGTTLVAISTSLPELSTVLGAVRLRRYELAVADIFGSNLFCLALIPVVDLSTTEGPVLATGGP